MKKLLLCCVFILAFTACIAQQRQQEGENDADTQADWKENVFFGMGGGLQLGSNTTLIAVYPQVGYRITPKLAGGLNFTYQYVRYKGYTISESHTYGAGAFGRYSFIPQAFFQTEYEQLNFNVPTALAEQERQWIERWLLGAGYFASAGGRGGFQIAVLYDMLYSQRDNNPFGTPWVYRIGFVF